MKIIKEGKFIFSLAMLIICVVYSISQISNSVPFEENKVYSHVIFGI